MKDGLITLCSGVCVAETMARVFASIRGHGLMVFASIDHAEAARGVGLDMNPASLVIFGNPRSGTPLMKRAPTLAIDLPLKVLIWQDDDGAVWLSYNTPAWLAERHGIRDLDLPAMVWEYEGGADGEDQGIAGTDTASAFTEPTLIKNSSVLQAMDHTLAAIASEATRSNVA